MSDDTPQRLLWIECGVILLLFGLAACLILLVAVLMETCR